MMDNKQIYREHCKHEKSIPIFSKDWWLDAVCGENNWEVALAEENGQIVGCLPYYLKMKYGLRLITMPKLTQSMGIWIRYRDNQKYSAKLAYEKNVVFELIDKLPKFDAFIQTFHYSITNWLPFYWRNYQQTTKYTYIIEDLSDLERVFDGFNYSKIKNIRKAEKIVDVKYDLSANIFYENHKMTLKKQGQNISYSFDLLKNIYDAAYEHSSGKTIYAIDCDGNIHSALFVIWDDESTYNLISTIDPDYRNSGSSSLLIREIIKYISDKTKVFDFEGSMIENVENSFRQFGTVQKPYFQVYKVNSRIIKVANFLRDRH